MSRSRAAIAAAALLAAAAVAHDWSRYSHVAGIDFYQFWLVGQLAGEVQDPYDPGARRSMATAGAAAATGERQQVAAKARPVLETYSTPFLYAVIRAVSVADYETSYNLFRLLSLLATVASTLLLCRLFGWSPAPSLLLVAVLVAAAAPLISDARVANVNQLQMAALAALLALLWHDQALASGLVAAVLVLFKPNLAVAEALLLAGWVLRGELRTAALHLAGAVVAAAAAILVSGAVFGSLSVWVGWLRALAALDRELPLRVSQGNFSLAHLAGVPPAAAAAALLAGSVAATWRGRKTAPPAEARIAAVGAGVGVVLLGAALVWEHYYLLMTPLLLYFLRPAAQPHARRWALAAIVAWLLPWVTTRRAPIAVIALEVNLSAAILLGLSWSALAGRKEAPELRAVPEGR